MVRSLIAIILLSIPVSVMSMEDHTEHVGGFSKNDIISFFTAQHIADMTINLLSMSFKMSEKDWSFKDLRSSLPDTKYALAQGVKVITVQEIPCVIYTKWGKWQFLEQLACPEKERLLLGYTLSSFLAASKKVVIAMGVDEKEIQSYKGYQLPAVKDDPMSGNENMQLIEQWKKLEELYSMDKKSLSLKARL